MICWKIRIFAYWTTPGWTGNTVTVSCDLLKNSYLCLLNNTASAECLLRNAVVICWKIRIFAYWTTPTMKRSIEKIVLWFAEKFVSLLIEQHPRRARAMAIECCDLLKNSYLCLLNNTKRTKKPPRQKLWFAEKFVSLLIEQHLWYFFVPIRHSCDLLKNSYLCLLNNTLPHSLQTAQAVVICWKIRIFAYWTTPDYVEVAQYESVVSNDRNGKNPMLEGRNLNKREVSSFLLIYLHALSFPHEKTKPGINNLKETKRIKKALITSLF